MKDGFLKAGAVSPKVTVAGIRANADRIIELVTQASEKRIKLLVFPEMCLTGYTIGDLVFSSDMLSRSGSVRRYTILHVSSIMAGFLPSSRRLSFLPMGNSMKDAGSLRLSAVLRIFLLRIILFHSALT